LHNAAKLFETARRIDKLDLGKDFSISGQTRPNTVAAVLTAFFNRIRSLKVCSQKLMIKEKRKQFIKSFTKKQIQKFLIKIDEMADIFLNSANFAPHAFLTLAPPSAYALNLKAVIKVSKVSRTYQLSYEIFRSSFERKFDKTNFISPKKTPPYVF
jgi:hypothetical protein